MKPKHPVLAILPLQSLIIHEHHDPTRSGPLIEKIRASDVFTNPVIATPLHDHTARYMVLDGANRTTATRQLGYDHILAQVVEPDELGLEVRTWNHVVWDVPQGAFLARLQAIDGLEFRASSPDEAYDAVINRQGLAAVHLPDGRVYEMQASVASILDRNAYLNAIVDTYKNEGCLDRTSLRTVARLRKLYPTLSGLVFMPSLPIRHLISLVSQGQLVPAGVTRFTISPRALRVNFPLEILQSKRSLEEKNSELDKFIRSRTAEKGVRYYAEETVLYDE